MREHIKERLDNQILELYERIQYPVFPIKPAYIIKGLDNCEYISYDRLALVSHSSYNEVVIACNSYDGCTQYDTKGKRYLIVVNTSARHNASKARIRWTCAHEIGHVLSGHFIELEGSGEDPSDNAEMEEEADYFAASFLAPLPAIKYLNATRPADIRDWFGLSQIAAEYRWNEYKRAIADHRLDTHFRFYRPRSTVKSMSYGNVPGISIIADNEFAG